MEVLSWVEGLSRVPHQAVASEIELDNILVVGSLAAYHRKRCQPLPAREEPSAPPMCSTEESSWHCTRYMHRAHQLVWPMLAPQPAPR